MKKIHTILALVAGITAVSAMAQAAPPLPRNYPKPRAVKPRPDPQMKAVLDSLASLHPKPIEKLSAAEARKQPGPPQAVKALLVKQGRSTAPEAVGSVKDIMVPGQAGQIPARVYTPSGTGPFPVVVYFHGGGWVIAGINAYDSSCRALCNASQAIVVSVGYRLAPEHRFPAQHEDSYAASQYIFQNAGSMNGDPKRIAVAGESAGGNLATSVCLMAKERGGIMPLRQVLVYPLTDTYLGYPSIVTNAGAKPLNRAMLPWFLNRTIAKSSNKNNEYLALARKAHLTGLPPATVITADIDPLRSEGKVYADRLRKYAVAVHYMNYMGVTHEFFGMTAVLDKAKAAVAFAAADLKKSFAAVPSGSAMR